jgi:hypothetical protein
MKFVSRITIIGLAIAVVAGSGIAVAKSPHQGRPAPRGERTVPPSTVRPDQTSSIPRRYAVVNSGSLPAPTGAQTHGEVLCPPNTVVWGGGVFIQLRSLWANVNSSYPTGSTGWAANVNNASGSDTTFTVYAICAKQPRNYAVVSAVFPNPAESQSTGEVSCPGTSKVLGGGSYSDSASTTYANINSTLPISGKTWWVNMNNGWISAHVTVFAVCGNTRGRARYSGSIQVPNPAGEQTFSSVSCPAGQVPSGGGGYSSALDHSAVTLNSTYPDGAGWSSYENNAGSGNPPYTKSFVICVGGP